jgi:hypothetical protein
MPSLTRLVIVDYRKDIELFRVTGFLVARGRIEPPLQEVLSFFRLLPAKIQFLIRSGTITQIEVNKTLIRNADLF